MGIQRETEVLTVAAVRSGEAGQTEVLFHERARVFKVVSTSAAGEKTARHVQGALEDGRPIRATIDLRSGTLVGSVDAKEQETEAFHRGRSLLEKPERPVKIDVHAIDPTVFNFVDIHQKWKVFGLCTKVVPSYKKAKEIFDYCAALSCNLPGPYATPPCIPFQYVRDGCYARAHQMRRIITTKYGYCCEKVFSFANSGNDVLAVKADKWGGCCVQWWYHVAPLIRVRFKIPILPKVSLALAMVVDPGMFDKPVLLSTWLGAQQNTTCSSRAHVSKYTVQAGSAYAPANFEGTAFSTDTTYTQTEATLLAYAGLTTC